MSEFTRRDPIEDVEATPDHIRMRKASVRDVEGGIEITLPSTFDEAFLYFVSKPVAARSKATAKASPTEPFDKHL